MPFTPERLSQLRQAKGWERKTLADRANTVLSQVAKHENGDAQSAEMIERFADALDCTLDYLHERGAQYRDPTDAAIQMSFDVFARGASEQHREWCRRILLHHDSPPRTADAWRVLADQIEIAAGSSPRGRELRAVR